MTDATANDESVTLSVAALETAVTTLLQNNFDADTKVCLTTLMRMIDNVLQKPYNDKVRTINCANPNFHAKVGSRKGGIEYLQACGFTRQGDPEASIGGLLGSAPVNNNVTLVLQPQNEDTKHLITARRLLVTRATRDLGMKAEELPTYKPPPPPVQLTTDTSHNPTTRNTNSSATFNPYAGQRYDAASAALGTNLGPDANYVSKTQAELQKLQQRQDKLEQQLEKQNAAITSNREWTVSIPGQQQTQATQTIPSSSSSVKKEPSDSTLLAAHLKKQQLQRQKQEQQGFTTAAMRDLESMKKAKVYSHTLLTVQFADGIKLTGKFLPKERVEQVYRALYQDCFLAKDPAQLQFDLYVAPPRRVLDRKQTLQSEGLVPAAKIFVSWKGGSTPKPSPTQPGASYLFHELLHASGQAAQSTSEAFPSAHAVVQGEAKPSADAKADDTKKKADKTSKSDRESKLLSRMMGGGGLGGIGGVGTGGGSGADKSKKPKWFKG